MRTKTPFFTALFLFTLFVNLPQTQATQLRFRIWGWGASPGRSRDIKIEMAYQDIYITSFQFDFLYDESSLIMTEVERYDRGEVFGSMDVDSSENQLSISLQNAMAPLTPGGGYMGSGYILRLAALVGDHVPRGSEIILTLNNIVVTDTSGNKIMIPDNSGTFNVPVYDFSFSYRCENCWVVPGDNSIKTWIEISRSYVEASSFDFHILFDTNYFSVSHVEQIYETDIFSQLSWYSSEGGIHVFMYDSTVYIPEEYESPIVSIYFDVRNDAPEGEYTLTLDEITVRDTTGLEVPTTARKKLHMHVGIPSIMVIDTQGYAGSSGNVVRIALDNQIPLEAVMFDLLFDQIHLTATDVQRTERTRHVGIFQGGVIENVYRVVMAPFTSICTGTGPIADIFFDVMDDAPLGEYELSLPNVKLHSDLYGTARHINVVEGIFHIVHQDGDVNGDGIVSIEDIITTVDIILGYYEPSEKEFKAADCNDDDEVDVFDVVCIVNIILGATD